MNEHMKTTVAAVIAGLSGFGSWLFTLAPTYQTDLLKPMIDIAPISWRPALGLGLRGLAFASGLYATYRASKSGPATPTK